MSDAEWTNDMRRAKVPLAAGMVFTDPTVDGSLLRAERPDGQGGWYCYILENNGRTDIPIIAQRVAAERAIPVPTDRGTFLLCLDEAERWGIAMVWIRKHGGWTTWSLVSARALSAWDDENVRPHLIVALAHTLAETRAAFGDGDLALVRALAEARATTGEIDTEEAGDVDLTPEQLACLARGRFTSVPNAVLLEIKAYREETKAGLADACRAVAARHQAREEA